MLLSLLISNALAASPTITIINKTGASIRFEHLNNKCTGSLIKTPSPLVIEKGAQLTLQTSRAIHTYDLCGSGFCVQSAIGMAKTLDSYELIVDINSDGILRTTVKPDVFPGVIDCPGDSK